MPAPVTCGVSPKARLEPHYRSAAYLSLSHKRRASVGPGTALEIMVYAAEFPLPAA
jgi:hypothetical protein